MSPQSLTKSFAATCLGLALALSGCAAPVTKDGVVPSASADSATSASPRQATSADESLRGTFVRVVTGDTIELSPVSDKDGKPTGEPNVTVHILGIKAPALDACGGPESAAELKRIINTEGFFRVKYDPQSGPVDSAGNAQGYLFANDGSGYSNSIGPSMVQNGFAVAWYDSATEDRSVEMSDKAQTQKDYNVKTNEEMTRTAQEQKSGIWARCPVTVG